MNKNINKVPLIIFLLCIGQYFNQGISSLPSQCLYYLLRENWGLSATTLGIIGFVVGIAWYLKIFLAYFIDNVSIRGKTTTPYLIGSYTILLFAYLYIIIFGLNLFSLVATGLIINFCIATADVSVDKQMVVAEKKYKLKGRLQSVQWLSLGIAGFIVALGGAFIAKHLPEHVNYRVAYGLSAIVPLTMLVYFSKKFKEKIVKKIVKVPFKTILKNNLKKIKNKRLLIGLAFIACLQFCPSFGTALMIKVRETLHVDKLFLGYLGAMGTVLGVIGYAIYYKWAYKFPMKKLLYFMVIFSAITNLFYLYLPSKWVLVGYNLLFGAFGGVTFMALLAFFVKIIPTGSEAFFYALVTSVSNLFGRLGGVVGGIIYDHFGYTANVILASATTLICLLFIPYLKLEVVKNEL